MTTTAAPAVTTLHMTATAVTHAVLPGQFAPDFTRPQDARIFARTPTLADAEAIAALFPKTARVAANTLSGNPQYTGYVSFHARFTSDGTTGAKNEASVRRLARFLAAAEKAGLTIEYDPHMYSNSYPSREAFQAAIDA